MKKYDIAKYIDHTNLKAEAVEEDIKKLCKEAREYGFASVCINPCYVSAARKALEGSECKVCTVIGFPLGASETKVKVFESRTAVESGAQEIDMVINIGKLKDKCVDFVTEEIMAVVKAVSGQACVKVIIECCLLSDEEKILACKAAVNAGADFVKTSTGLSTHGATVEDVLLMKKVVGNNIKIKASGGIRDLEKAVEMIEAGAERIGTSMGTSMGVEIIKSL